MYVKPRVVKKLRQRHTKTNIIAEKCKEAKNAERDYKHRAEPEITANAFGDDDDALLLIGLSSLQVATPRIRKSH